MLEEIAKALKTIKTDIKEHTDKCTVGVRLQSESLIVSVYWSNSLTYQQAFAISMIDRGYVSDMSYYILSAIEYYKDKMNA